jgi:hypothetical protein
MKRYTCDVCKKEFGCNVGITLTNVFRPTDYIMDDFYYRQATDADLCNDCYNAIAEAMRSKLKELKEKK